MHNIVQNLVTLFFVDFSKMKITVRRKFDKFCYFVWFVKWFWNDGLISNLAATCQVKGMHKAMCEQDKWLKLFFNLSCNPLFFSFYTLFLLGSNSDPTRLKLGDALFLLGSYSIMYETLMFLCGHFHYTNH